MINTNTINTSVGINGGNGYAQDESNYQLWLRDPASSVIYLVEIDYVGDNGGAPKTYTINLSTRPYPPYKNVVLSIPSFSRQIGDTFTGAVTASYGELSLDNADGFLDAWITLNISGQKVRIFQGDPTWPRERFRLVNECLAEIVSSASWDKIVIRLRAQDFGSNLPIQTNLIPTTTTQTVANVVVPKSFGTVFNIDPAVVDATNQIYQWNDGPTTSVTDVRDGGVSFRTNQALVTSVSGNTQTCSSAHGFVAGTRVRSDVGSLPNTGNWTDVVWNGSIICAVGGGISATSTDGVSWMAGSGTLDGYKVAWNGTYFCAVSQTTDKVYASTNGLTWMTYTNPSASGNMIAVIAKDSSFFIFNDSGTLYRTNDFVTWSTSTAIGTTTKNVIWNGVTFVSIHYSAGFVKTSPDGFTWTTRVHGVSDAWVAGAWNGAVFCIVTVAGTNSVVSADGITWSTGTLSNGGLGACAIAWNGSVFCTVQNFTTQAMTSPDGIVWTNRTLPSSIPSWSAIVWNGTTFVVVAQFDSRVTASLDGTTWSAITSTPPTPLALSIDYWVSPSGLTTTAFQLSDTRGGTPITLTSSTSGGAWVGYHWTADNTTGKLYLDSKPAGKLTMDGVAPNNTVTTALMSTLSNISVDTISKIAFDAKCPQSIGINIKDRRNRIDVAADIISAVNGWYGAGRYGLLKFGRVEATNTIATASITKEDMIFNSLVLEKMIMPRKGHRVGYAKNYTVQTSGLFAGCSTDNVAYYKANEKVAVGKAATTLGADDVSNNLLAVIPDVDSSLLTLASDAAAEGYRLNEMYKGYSAIFTCEVGLIGTEIDVGDIVNVKYPRYGLSSGVNMTVVYVEDKPDTSTVTLKFFAYLGTYAPGQL